MLGKILSVLLGVRQPPLTTGYQPDSVREGTPKKEASPPPDDYRPAPPSSGSSAKKPQASAPAPRQDDWTQRIRTR